MRNSKNVVVFLIPTVICILFGIVFLIILSYAGFATVSRVFNREINECRMEAIFIEDYELLAAVVNYFINSNHSSIHIWPNSDEGYMSVRGNAILISDENVVETIGILGDQGYSVIVMSDNIIRFQRWSNLDSGRGMVFSIDGAQPKLQFLTRLEPLSKLYWYYYETNFNEWRLRHQSNE